MRRIAIAAAVLALALLGAPSVAFADVGNDNKTDPPPPPDHVKHHDYQVYDSPGHDGKSETFRDCQDAGIEMSRHGVASNYYCRFVENRKPGPGEPHPVCGTICPGGKYELWVKPGPRYRA